MEKGGGRQKGSLGKPEKKRVLKQDAVKVGIQAGKWYYGQSGDQANPRKAKIQANPPKRECRKEKYTGHAKKDKEGGIRKKGPLAQEQRLRKQQKKKTGGGGRERYCAWGVERAIVRLMSGGWAKQGPGGGVGLNQFQEREEKDGDCCLTQYDVGSKTKRKPGGGRRKPKKNT